MTFDAKERTDVRLLRQVCVHSGRPGMGEPVQKYAIGILPNLWQMHFLKQQMFFDWSNGQISALAGCRFVDFRCDVKQLE